VLVERSFGNYLKAYSLGEEQEADLVKRGREGGREGGRDGGTDGEYIDFKF